MGICSHQDDGARYLSSNDNISSIKISIDPLENRGFNYHTGLSFTIFSENLKGEIAKAYIVLKEGEDATEDEIIAFCREELAAYKCPRKVQFVNDVPKTSTGKIMRRELTTLDHLE